MIKPKFVFSILLFMIMSVNLYSQEGRRVIETAIPFLLISSDARASGLGDQGVATSADNFSQNWNQSKYVFIEKNSGFGFSYTPYLSSIVNDMFLGYITYFNKNSERSTWSYSLKYFNYGDVDFTTGPLETPLTKSPNQFTFDAGYALRLSEYFSMGISGRFLLSDLKIDEFSETEVSTSISFDISGFYKSNLFDFGENDAIFRGGFSFTNLGPKLKYSDSNEELFLPSNLKLGSGIEIIYDSNNSISFTFEINKLLVPSPSDPILDSNGLFTGQYTQPKIGFLEGFFKSFTDAPDGFSEELKEIIFSLGLEYSFNDMFFLRSGYFNEHELKGSRKFFTIGAGFATRSNFQIDLSYLISTSDVISPLENTLRFSLSYNIIN